MTQGLWEDVWGSTWPGTDPANSNYGAGADYPAYYVNWFDAIAFCNLLTVADDSIADTQQVYYSDAGLTTTYTKANAASGNDVYVDWDKTGYRLPTEAEWEYTARYIDGTSWNHGNHASGDKEYACHDEASCSHGLASDDRIGEYAWWLNDNSSEGTKEVGQKTANDLKLRDMSGNVFEWCFDWHDLYSGGSKTDPIGPSSSSSSSRVIRGGVWDGAAIHLPCAYRLNYAPSERSISEDHIGLRLCMTAD